MSLPGASRSSVTGVGVYCAAAGTSGTRTGSCAHAVTPMKAMKARTLSAPWFISIQRLPIEDHRESHDDHRERDERPDVRPKLDPAVALEQDAAHHAQEMGRGEHLADRLGPAGHAAEREHEAREQHRGQEVEERELHRLELVLRERRERDAD